jgi:hypothetical protein
MAMHKSDGSDPVSGVNTATNDIGPIVLPDGPRLAIVGRYRFDAQRPYPRAAIARIARAAYDTALRSY